MRPAPAPVALLLAVLAPHVTGQGAAFNVAESRVTAKEASPEPGGVLGIPPLPQDHTLLVESGTIDASASASQQPVGANGASIVNPSLEPSETDGSPVPAPVILPPQRSSRSNEIPIPAPAAPPSQEQSGSGVIAPVPVAPIAPAIPAYPIADRPGVAPVLMPISGSDALSQPPVSPGSPSMAPVPVPVSRALPHSQPPADGDLIPLAPLDASPSSSPAEQPDTNFSDSSTPSTTSSDECTSTTLPGGLVQRQQLNGCERTYEYTILPKDHSDTVRTAATAGKISRLIRRNSNTRVQTSKLDGVGVLYWRVSLTPTQALGLLNDPDISAVIKRSHTGMSGLFGRLAYQNGAPEGLVRVGQAPGKPIKSYKSNYVYEDVAGEGVEVYVLDSGAELDHKVRTSNSLPLTRVVFRSIYKRLPNMPTNDRHFRSSQKAQMSHAELG